MAMKIIRKAILNASEAKRAQGAMEGAMCPFLPKKRLGKASGSSLNCGDCASKSSLCIHPSDALCILAFRGISMTDLEGSRSKFQGTHV